MPGGVELGPEVHALGIVAGETHLSGSAGGGLALDDHVGGRDERLREHRVQRICESGGSVAISARLCSALARNSRNELASIGF
jgi:hypothetical protein